MEKTLETITNTEITETTELQATEKPYTFRSLETTDIFPMFKLLNKIGFKELKDNDSLKNVLFMFMGGTVNGKVDVNKVGIDIFLELACLITECIPKAETEIYALLSQVSDRTTEEIQKQPPAVTFEMILDFVKKEEFGDFFKVASKLFK